VQYFIITRDIFTVFLKVLTTRYFIIVNEFMEIQAALCTLLGI